MVYNSNYNALDAITLATKGLTMKIKHKILKLLAKESLARMRKRVLEASIKQRLELMYGNIFYQGLEGYKHDARYNGKWW